MKLPCEMVQDLLPLYHDGVCSTVSKENIEEHLSGCEKCRTLCRALDGEIEAVKEVEAAKPLASIGSAWKRTTKRALMKGVGITVLVFAVVIGFLLALTQWKCIPIDPVQMEVAEIYEMADGRILYRLDVPAGVWSRNFKFTHCGDGSTYLTPMRSLIELGEQQGWGSLLDGYLMIDAAEDNAWLEKQGLGSMTRYYIGQAGDWNPLLVWEEGMELEPAPEHLEAKYG